MHEGRKSVREGRREGEKAPNDTIIVRLKKALYGCVESSKLWYDKISGDMCKLGFTINPYDICVFHRIEACGSQTTCVIHVDDMMTTCKDQKKP